MNETTCAPRVIRFGAFEVDLRAGELRKHGLKIKLQEKPLQILAMLLDRPGELVAREEMRKKLWSADVFVDFDHSLNTAVNKLRVALADSAVAPRFVETVARRGYRFVAPIEEVGESARDSRELPTAIDSLAVLPFANVSGEPEMEYLSDGITESVINSLSSLPELRVMARSTVFRLKGSEMDPQVIGRSLGVGAVVTGRVDQHNDHIVIGAELVEAANGWQLWGQQFNRKVSDLVEVQEEIAKEISEKLRLRLTGEEKNRLAHPPTGSAEAYQNYLHGRYYWNQMTEGGLKKGIEYFEKAIQHDPHYALAYAGLAESYNVLVAYDLLPARDVSPRVKGASARALESDNQLAVAHTSLAVAGLFYDWDWTGAEGEFKRAIELNANYSASRYWYGIYLTGMGRFDEAYGTLKAAQRLEPFSVIVRAALGLMFYCGRDGEKAIYECRQALEFDPDFYPAHGFLGMAHQQRGDFSDALVEFQEAIRLSDGAPPALAMLGHACAVMGRKDQAYEILRKLKELGKQRYVPPARLALLHAGLGEIDQAFEWLEKAFEERSSWLLFLKVDPLLDCLRSDARYTELVRRIGLDP